MAPFEPKPLFLHRRGIGTSYDEPIERPYGGYDVAWNAPEWDDSPDEKLRPLVVDLDGTLIASDLLIETAFSELGRRPQSLLDMCTALSKGKAALKHRLAEPCEFDPSTLPYDPEVLAIIRQAKEDGRPVYLASASHRRLVEAVADHIGLFTGWFASNETTNLAGVMKAQKLVEIFGERGFDYIGNDAADLPVWEKAAKAIAIRAPAGVMRRLAKGTTEVECLPCSRPTWRTWAKMLRVHQYAKNALVFAPLLTAHLFTAGAVIEAIMAFIAFSLCASSIYILNDLVDLQDDRSHRTKCNRPLASGAVPLLHGVMAIPVLFLGAIAIASAVSLPFLGVLLGYFALTTAYTFALKRMMLLDVITLAGLYSVRVLGGAVALDIAVSKWLLAFSMMIFMSLALIKRFVELAARRDADLPDPTSRDYKNGDLEMVAALAAAAGFNAVTIFALYISSTSVNTLYTRPEILWLVGPLLMYWIARALMLANRRQMDDDPVVFALKDRISLATIGTAAVLFFAAV
ncbi:UbiA family prenyltransferase [Microvirga sp. GCM10011540]|uniref:UbiA family prenyltransferase n=1 Tax=Microvirga sp. GCM10011540 TaxID=3317338 RepID=UPI00360849B9